MYNQQKAHRQWQNSVNKAQGQAFEASIKSACLIYRDQGKAEIDKTPEPFIVMKKHADGTFICIGIQDKFFFIPWTIWKNMKDRYGRQYITSEDVKEFQVRFIGAVMFLNYKNVVVSADGSRVMYDKLNPRTEVEITEEISSEISG